MDEKTTISIKITQDEQETLDQASKKAGLTRSGFIRYHSLRKAREVLDNE